MRVERVEVAVCQLALPQPIHLGSMVYRTRDYVALRLLTSEGPTGHALGFTRGVPVAEGIVGLSPLLLDRDLGDPSEFLRTVRRAFIPGWPGLIRSASLVDIALWDIAAKTAELPLWRLLGGTRTSSPAVAVAGYFGDRRSVESVVEEVATRAAEGHRLVKLVLAAHNPGRDAAVLSAVRSSLPEVLQLGVDAHAAWTSVEDAVAACRPLEEFGLEFIEDPFVPQAWRLTRELRGRLRTRLAAGEDVVGIEGLVDALEAAQVLRVDATSCGGITQVLEAIDLATSTGHEVLPVVWPGLHAQLASARPGIANVEIIPEDTRAELSGQLLRDSARVAGGSYQLQETPGAGMELDWETVRRLASAEFSA